MILWAAIVKKPPMKSQGGTTMKKFLALILTLCLTAALLTGCGSTGSENGDNGKPKEPTFVYTADYTPLEIENLNYVMSAAVAGDYVYMAGEVEVQVPYNPDGEGNGDVVPLPMPREKVAVTGIAVEAETMAPTVEVTTGGSYDPEAPDYVTEWVTKLYKANKDGSNVKEIESYEPIPMPEDKQGFSNLAGIYPKAEGGFMVLNMVSWNNMDYTEWGTDYYIQHFDANDNLVETNKLADVLGQDEYVNNMLVDKAGNIIMNCTEKLFVMTPDGQVKFEVERANDDWAEMVLLGDGNVAAIVYSYDEVAEKQVITLKILDMTAQTWQETSYTVDVFTEQLYPGDSKYDFYYTYSNTLFGYDVETGTATEVLNFIEAGVDKNYMNYMTIGDGEIVGIEFRWDEETGRQKGNLINMTLVDASTLPERKTLTIGVAYEDYELNDFVIQFNRTNTEYKLSIKNYGAYNTHSDSEAGITKLSTEVIAGNGPDILETSWLPVEQYVSKGLLVPISDYLDKDPELSVQGVVEPLRKAMEIDGKLYQTVSRFNVKTTYGLSKVVGTEMGWTFRDMMEARQMLQEGAYTLMDSETRSYIMSEMVYGNLDHFVNWQTGECSFDTPEFVNILNFAKDFPTEFDWTDYEYVSQQQLLTEGRLLMVESYVSNLMNLVGIRATYDEDLTFVGMPSEDGYGAYFQTGYFNFSITENCDDPDGAWSVIRHFMTQEFQENSWQFPANAAAFEKQMQEAMTVTYQTDENGEFILDENGEKIPEVKEWAWNELTGESIEITCATQEDADLLMEILNNTTRVYTQNSSLYEIVEDSVGAFFAGQRSAEDTAALIQSRAKLHVNEQK